MTILNWDKPKKILSTEAWKSSPSFDGGPIGGFRPNMSNEDAFTWKAKIVGANNKETARVEIRKSFRMAQILLIVTLGNGYTYNTYKPERTKGINVHFSTNGAMQLTFEDMENLHEAVKEAREALNALA